MLWLKFILGDPGADSGGEGKFKRAGKKTARRKVRNGEKSPFWLLIGARKSLCFSAQSEGSTPMIRLACPYTE